VTPNAVVILQARMSSRRLPGKALALLGRSTVLAHCLRRLQEESPVPVVLATTEGAVDDPLEEEAARLGVRTFRGPAEDVLARFIQVARRLNVDHVVRATADNPAVDTAAPARVLALMAERGADYATETGLPYGAAVEAVSVDALIRAHDRTDAAADREHVTLFIKRDRLHFHAVERPAPAALQRPELRLTVDTADDLEYMRRLLGGAAEYPPLETIIEDAAALALFEGHR
jgi:spore coat polysaccharide biosynthesis protein SpsF